MIHLYCIVPNARRGAVAPMPGLSGVSSSRVRALPLGTFSAWVSDVERGMPVHLDGVKAHDSVIEAALATGNTPVPARFGQRFEDDEACMAALQRRAEPVSALLDMVSGQVEMTLLIAPSTSRMLRDLEPVLPTSASSSPHGPGRSYLESLRSREDSAGQVRAGAAAFAQRVSEAVEQFVHRTTEHQPVTRLPMLTVSHLITRAAVDEYRTMAQSVPPGAEFRLLVIGPRAPYSFCALRADDGGGHGMNLAG